MTNKIQCMVGDQMRLVEYDLFFDIHEHLADYYRALGLTGGAISSTLSILRLRRRFKRSARAFATSRRTVPEKQTGARPAPRLQCP